MNTRIRKRLIDLNLSVTALTRVVGYTFAYTHRVLSGREKSLQAKKKIAACLNASIGELWPECVVPIVTERPAENNKDSVES